MKQIVFVVLLALASTLTACSKDEKKDEDNKSLIGTSWVCEQEWNEDGNTNTVKITLKLIDGSNVTRTSIALDSNNEKIDEFQESGTYTYSNSVMELVFIHPDNGTPYTETGIIDGNKMTFTGSDWENIYIKQ